MRRQNLFYRLMSLLMLTQWGIVEGEGGGSGENGNANGENNGDNGNNTATKDEAGKGGKEKNDSGLSDEAAKLLKELMGIKGANKDLSVQLAQAKEQLTRFEGIDVDEVKALLKSKQDAENARLEQKGEWERLRVNLVEQHDKEKSELQSQIQELTGKLSAKDQSIVDLSIGSVFRGSSFIAEELVLTPAKAQIIYGNHFEFEDGQVVGYDKPRGSANRTPLIDGKGEPLSFDAAMAKIIDSDQDKERMVRAKIKSGSGSGNDDGRVRTPTAEVRGVDRIKQSLDTNKG